MTTTKQDAERRFAQIEGERDYYKRQAERREQQLLKGLRALGISCSSVDQCAEFEREVFGAVNVLTEQRGRAEHQRDQLREALEGLVKYCDNDLGRTHWRRIARAALKATEGE